MDRFNRVVDSSEIEAKKIFSQVIDFEYKLINYFLKGKVNLPLGVTQDEYFKKLHKEYVKLFLERAKTVERRNK